MSTPHTHAACAFPPVVATWNECAKNPSVHHWHNVSVNVCVNVCSTCAFKTCWSTATLASAWLNVNTCSSRATIAPDTTQVSCGSRSRTCIQFLTPKYAHHMQPQHAPQKAVKAQLQTQLLSPQSNYKGAVLRTLQHAHSVAMITHPYHIPATPHSPCTKHHTEARAVNTSNHASSRRRWLCDD